MHLYGLCIVFVCFQAVDSHVKRTKRWLQGTRPPGSKCAFNPCVVDNFCGTGRRCELDDNCIHHCICEPESEHEDCVTSSISTTSPLISSATEPPACTFNPCQSPFMCSGARKCILDGNCMVSCLCEENSWHESCKNSTDSTDCSLNCVHGNCLKEFNSYSCECDEGWSGPLCNVRNSVCSRTCEEGYRCFRYESIEQCIKPTTDTSVTSTSTSKTSVSNSSDACNDEYTARLSTCNDGKICTFGLCETGYDGESTCKCDNGASGVRCTSRCCRECGPNGTCALTETGEETCSCFPNFTGSNCTDPLPEVEAPEEPKWYLWVVGVSAVVLLLLLILLILLPYLMWRHRVILIMKVVHYFQGYEDDDDRQWDAFISYRANDNDERFVVHTLMQKLEDELGFKLNVHFRDFELGETIANNILKAIQGSRRTILIITPEFVRSEFTRFEYEKARQEMITKKHRIIPVLLEDVSDVRDTMDQTLKDILSSVTYIEWPRCGTQKKIDKFWKRIELSLPKKKNSDGPDPTRNQVNNMADPCDVSIVDEPKTCRRPSGLYTTINDSFISDEPGYDVINHDKLDMKSRDNRVSENLNNDVEKQERYLEILNA